MRIFGGIAAPHAFEAGPGDPCVSLHSAAAERGIIVIGGSQQKAAAAGVDAAVGRGPALQGIIIVGGAPVTSALSALEEMGSLAIQSLMSSFNQSEALATTVRKQSEEVTRDIAGKLG